MGDISEGILCELEVVKLKFGAVKFGKILPVGQLSLSPEEFDTVQVRSIGRIPNQWDFFKGEPVLDCLVVVNTGIVHEDAPLVPRRQTFFCRL